WSSSAFIVKPHVSLPAGLFLAKASRKAFTPSKVCQADSSRGCTLTSLETSQGVVRIMIQSVTNRLPFSVSGSCCVLPMVCALVVLAHKNKISKMYKFIYLILLVTIYSTSTLSH